LKQRATSLPQFIGLVMQKNLNVQTAALKEKRFEPFII
jgi:hypothetical protein